MSNDPKILIDGYNYIFRRENIDAENRHGLEEARERLIAKLASYRRGRRVSLTVVFDGDDMGPHPHSYLKNGVKVIFSQPPSNADTVIKKIIQSESNPKNLTVVTSDRAVSDFAAQAGCATLESESFYLRLRKMTEMIDYETKFGRELSEEEVQEWISLFNDPQDLKGRL